MPPDTVEVLSPRLTPLDESVLKALPTERPGIRAVDLARWLNRRASHWRAIHVSDRQLTLRIRDTLEVRRVLRGFEHLGQARCRAGWWTAA